MLTQKVAEYAKFIIAAIGVAVTVGVLDDQTAQDIAGALTALAVLFVPNRPPVA